jgi:hypothetical protein
MAAPDEPEMAPDRIARMAAEVFSLPEDQQRAAFAALTPEDFGAIRNFAEAKRAHYVDQSELVREKLAQRGLLAVMRGFAAIHPDLTPQQLAEAFLRDGETTAQIAKEFDEIRRKHGGDA